MGYEVNLTLYRKKHEHDLYRLDWLTTKEAAIYLRTTEGAIRSMVYKGKLTPHKPFGKLLFRRRDLNRLIERARLNGVQN